MIENNSAVIRPRIHSAQKKSLQDLMPIRTPISAHIDISSVCNYKCSFCFQADVPGMKAVGLKRGFMSFEMFKKIVDELKEFPEKIKKIKIGNHGEPTLNPDVVQMVEYASKSECTEIVEMFTNGSKLDPKLNQGLVDAGLQRINVSLEGLSDQRYYQVAGVRQDFQSIVAGVKDLFERKKAAKSNLKIYVKIADHAHALKKDSTEIFVLSESEKEFFHQTFGNICDEIFIEKVVPQWAETQLNKQNEVDDTGMYGQKINNSWKEVCPFVFMYLHFNCDGTVSPCTLDWPRKVVVGNINKDTVSEIWNGKSLKELQIAMLSGKRKCIEFCGACSAPMVCVEEDLDSDRFKVIKAINGEKEFERIEENSWINKYRNIRIGTLS
jgi:radical SAM protein with 4Fe4S-binding SPASM domain